MRAILCLLLMVIVCFSEALADETDTFSDIESIPRVLLGPMRQSESYREQYVAQLVQVMRDGTTRDALTKEDIGGRAHQVEVSKRREQYLDLVYYDLDFNGTITRQEVTQLMTEERIRSRQNVEGCADDAAKFVGRYDTNKDGSISLAEMSRPPNLKGGRMDSSVRRLKALLALDPNHDGKLTAAELEALTRKAFATIDSDSNGMLSYEEAQIAREAFNDDF